MKEKLTTKILMTIVTVIVCSVACVAVPKMILAFPKILAHYHMHPPTNHDLKKQRESLRKDLEKHRSAEDAKKESERLTRAPKKESKYKHPKWAQRQVN